MENFLKSKRFFYILTLICLAGFLILPKSSLAENFENITLEDIKEHLELPAEKVESLLYSLINIFHKEWEILMVSPYSIPEEMAVPIIMREATRIQALNHLLIDAPIQTIWAIVKNATKIARVFLAKDPSVILNELEKESVEKAVGYGMSVLFENEIRVTPGAIEFRYPLQEGGFKEVIFQYIIIYKPIDNKNGKVLIRFYSLKPLEPPENRGSLGGTRGFYTELTHNLPPFIVDIQGIVENYQWKGNPSIKIEFPESVPDLGIKPLTFWEKYVLKPIESQIKEVEILVTKVTGKSLGLTDIWEKVKSFISKITTFFPAALVQTPEVKEAPSATNDASRAESQPVNPEPQLEPEPEPESKLTLVELQEMLDDLAEKIDIFSRQVSELVEAKKQQTEKEIKEIKEDEEDEEEIEELTQIDKAALCKMIGQPTRNKVIFNEIAWMGSSDSANHEWIELKNISGANINLAGWQILDKDNQIKIIFTAQPRVLSNGFWLLERTSDDSVTEVAADFIYAGSLSNQSEALYVFNENCQLQDQVLASPDWPAGDNTSKRTMERKPDLTWQTSLNPGGTPKRENSSGYVEYYAGVAPSSPEQATSTPTQEEVPPLAVVVNEIAWMGTSATNSSDEWIELYNNSSTSIDLADWTLSWSRGTSTHTITFSPVATTTIADYGFYLLERTDDNTVKDVSADWFGSFGSGGLNNSGEKLELKDARANLIDLLDCSSGWFAGSSSPDYISMERINPRLSGSDPQNWANNNQTIINGLDAEDNSINGTPRAQNSVYQSLPPAEVTDLAIDFQNSFGNRVNLFWSSSTDPDTLSEDLSYQIYYLKESLNKDNLESASISSTTATTITISDLDYNSTYYFGVKAFDGQNYSELSTTTDPYRTATLATIVSGFSANDLNPDNMKNNGRKISRASNGDFYVVYSRVGKIFLAKSINQGIDWTEIEATPQEQLEQINPSIAIDSQNNLHLVWQGKATTSAPYQIRYRKYNGNSFSEIENLTENSEWEQEIPVIAIDPQDDVHVVWVNKQQTPDRDNNLVSAPQLLYRIFTNQWETIEKVAEIYKGGFSSFALAIDSQDNLHLISRESRFWDTGSEEKIQYRKKTTSGWAEIGQLDSDDLQNDFPSLAIDNQNNLHLVWYRPYFNQCLSEIKYLKYTASATSWSEIETLDRNEFTGQWVIASPSIALDSQGHLYVIWKRWNEKISQKKYSNSWEEVKNLNLGSQDSFAFTNLLWSFYPIADGKKTNQPETGYAFIFYEGTELKFYQSEDFAFE